MPCFNAVIIWQMTTTETRHKNSWVPHASSVDFDRSSGDCGGLWWLLPSATCLCICEWGDHFPCAIFYWRPRQPAWLHGPAKTIIACSRLTCRWASSSVHCLPRLCDKWGPYSETGTAIFATCAPLRQVLIDKAELKAGNDVEWCFDPYNVFVMFAFVCLCVNVWKYPGP